MATVPLTVTEDVAEVTQTGGRHRRKIVTESSGRGECSKPLQRLSEKSSSLVTTILGYGREEGAFICSVLLIYFKEELEYSQVD